MQKGISTLKDISSSNCLLSFQELCERYGTEPSSLFLYLRLRWAMKVYGVPWGESLPMHPIIAWFGLSSDLKGRVGGELISDIMLLLRFVNCC